MNLVDIWKVVFLGYWKIFGKLKYEKIYELVVKLSVFPI